MGVPRDATSAQIKKAYHKKALKLHPDKINKSASEEEIEEAKLKFQAISAAYQILSDDEKRKEYDATGELIDEDDFVSSSEDGFCVWEKYFKSIFGSINFSDIDNFAKKYQGSEEEKKDVLRYYETCKGDLNKMVACVMCSNKLDKPRWVKEYIEPAIKKKTVPRYDALARTLDQDVDDDVDFLQESSDEQDEYKNDENKSSNKSKSKARGATSRTHKPTKKKPKVSKEAEEMMAEDLIARIRGKQNGAIAQREKAFNSMMDDLEARYSKKSGGKKGKKVSAAPEIPDDEFEKIQAKLEKNRKSGKRSR